MNNNMQKHSQRGFTLLEVTVAMLVLSIGMLGIGALFFEGLKSGRTALYRTTAVYLAEDMADRIRANPLGLAAYENAGADNGCLNGPNNCTAAQIAQEDKMNWDIDVNEHLPPGSAATVTVAVGVASTVYDIDMAWPESGFDLPLTYSLEVEL